MSSNGEGGGAGCLAWFFIALIFLTYATSNDMEKVKAEMEQTKSTLRSAMDRIERLERLVEPADQQGSSDSACPS